MARRNRPINMSAPYLRRVWLDPARILNRDVYPFVLSLLRDDLELSCDKAITIIVGENGTGKGYRPVDHSDALEEMGRSLASAGA
jgi:hypothetical protein